MEERVYGRGGVLTEPIIRELVEGSRAALGVKLLSIVLYGSVARGDNEPESDIDVALFVTDKLTREEESAMIHHFSSMCLEHELEFAPMDIEQAKFDQWRDELPYYRSIQREGIVLWAA